MLRTAEGISRGCQADIEWERDVRERSKQKEWREKEQEAKIVARQREVAREYEAALQELIDFDLHEKREYNNKLVEQERAQFAKSQRSARKSAQRQAQLYADHEAGVQRRQEFHARMQLKAQEKLEQQQAALRAAAKRQDELKKQADLRLREKRKAFEAQREAIHERRKEEERKREEKEREWRKQQKELDKNLLEFEAKRAAEWAERSQASQDMMMGTMRSHHSALESEREALLEAWDSSIENIEARVQGLREGRSASARAHSVRHRKLTQRFAQRKEEQDSARAVLADQKAVETHARLASLTASRQQEERKRLKQMRDDFQVQHQIEQLRWQHEVKKSPPNEVRASLTKAKVPGVW